MGHEEIKNKEPIIKDKRAKVLVADDEQVIRDLFERFLTRQDYQVVTAIDGCEALERVRADNFDMLIMDLKMPKMDGMELLKKLKELKKDLIIIVITGYGTIDTTKEAIRQGCFDYITKPFNVEDISITIKRAFNLRQLTEEKKKLQTQLEIAERLALLGEMGAGVAHEVNTVLTAVKLFLEILSSKSSQASDYKNINLVLDEIERAEKLIARFLEFAKPGEPEFVTTDINVVIRRSLQFLKFKINKQKIEIIDVLGEDIPKVFCDPEKMEGVFLNLISNSIEAMPTGGTLTITSAKNNEKVLITISDSGVGIAPENIPKLYIPFFTTKAHGTGLGLSIVHRIIDAHKGLIAISSQLDKGTTVRIELPLNADDHR